MHYGKKDAHSVDLVKQLYNKLDLERVFKAYEEESYARLSALIADTDTKRVPKQVFTSFAAKIYKRQK